MRNQSKKIFALMLLSAAMSLSACTPTQPAESDSPQPTVLPSTPPTQTPTSTPDVSETPLITPSTIAETDQPLDGQTKPYDFSTLVEVDFSIMNRDIPAQGCSGDFTEEQCIELYGTKPLIPEGIEFSDDGIDGDYHHFTVTNTFTGTTISFGIIQSIYDSYLSDVSYTLDESNNLLIQFFIDYTNDIRVSHPEAYDIEQRYYQTGGPLYSHTAYYLNEQNTVRPGTTIAQRNGFKLNRYNMQDSNYVSNMPDPQFAQQGMDYITNCEFIIIE